MGILAAQRIAGAVLVVLAFSKSLTLPILFPLKLYEPLILIGLAAAFSEGPLDIGPNSRFTRLWLIFWLSSLISTAFGTSLVLENDISSLLWAQGRYEPTINALFHTAYLGLDIAALALFLSLFQQGQLGLREFCRYWTIGALVAVGYSLLLQALHTAGLPLTLAGRWNDPQLLELSGISIVRNGPFEEGNYFGLYLVLSYGLCLWASRRFDDRIFARAPLLIAVATMQTGSPAAIASIGVLMTVSFFEGGLPRAVRTLQLSLLIAVGGLILFTPLLQQLVLGKFSLLIYGGITDAGNVSLVQRINEMHHGWKLFLQHPYGVGIGNFGYFWGQVPEMFPWLNVDYALIKQIPNMIYLEILSEQGLQGFAIFVLAMYALWRPLFEARERILSITVLCMLGYFLAFPTFRLVFLWVFWAFVIRVGALPRPGAGIAAPPRSATPVDSSAN